MYISESDKAEIRQLIEQQLQAFQQQNPEVAFSLTSPTIQKKYTQQDFIKIMKGNYNAIIEPRSIMFRGFTMVDNFPALVSTIMEGKGNLVQGIFIVQHQTDYSWRIHGYELLPINQKII